MAHLFFVFILDNSLFLCYTIAEKAMTKDQ